MNHIQWATTSYIYTKNALDILLMVRLGEWNHKLSQDMNIDVWHLSAHYILKCD